MNVDEIWPKSSTDPDILALPDAANALEERIETESVSVTIPVPFLAESIFQAQSSTSQNVCVAIVLQLYMHMWHA